MSESLYLLEVPESMPDPDDERVEMILDHMIPAFVPLDAIVFCDGTIEVQWLTEHEYRYERVPGPDRSA